jgi:tripartite-type tricarboxylate transporter receptor subunit TctC
MNAGATLLSAASTLVGDTANVGAQPSPAGKSIRLIVGFPPGSCVDTVARLLGRKMAEPLQAAVVVENLTGAGGTIAAERFAKAPPDGSTLALLSNAQLAINPFLYKVAYDPHRDFSPVSLVASSPYVLVVHNALPVQSVKDLVAIARRRPGELTFASGGGVTLLAGELFKSVARVDIRPIPYKGVAAAMPDLLGGRVAMMFAEVGALRLVREGKLRALAVSSLARLATDPELPTIAESGYAGFDVTVWQGLLTPAGASAATVGKLHAETVNAIGGLQTRLVEIGMQGITSSPDQFAALIQRESAKWARVIKEAGVRPE